VKGKLWLIGKPPKWIRSKFTKLVCPYCEATGIKIGRALFKNYYNRCYDCGGDF